MVERPDRIRIWSSQLQANDFPPICAISGAPAETWRRFRFATVPGWAYVFLLLLLTGIGLLPIFIVMAIVSRRASGYLPLTLAMKRRLLIVDVSAIGLIALAMLLFLIAVVVLTVGDIGPGWLLVGGGIILVAGIIVLVVVRPLVGPRANVMSQQAPDGARLVELRRLSPVFVAAVHQAQAARWQHYYGQSGPPLAPGSQPT